MLVADLVVDNIVDLVAREQAVFGALKNARHGSDVNNRARTLIWSLISLTGALSSHKITQVHVAQDMDHG